MAREDGEKRRYGVATYWASTPWQVHEAHLLAKLGGFDSMTGLVREVVDGELDRLRVQHGEAIATARAAFEARNNEAA